MKTIATISGTFNEVIGKILTDPEKIREETNQPKTISNSPGQTTRKKNNRQIIADIGDESQINRVFFLTSESDDNNFRNIQEIRQNIMSKSNNTDRLYLQSDLKGGTFAICTKFQPTFVSFAFWEKDDYNQPIISSISVMLPNQRIIDEIDNGNLKKEELPYSPHILGLAYKKDYTADQYNYWLNKTHTEMSCLPPTADQYNDPVKTPNNLAVKNLFSHMLELVNIGHKEGLKKLTESMMEAITRDANIENGATINSESLYICLKNSRAAAQPIITLTNAFAAAQEEITRNSLLTKDGLKNLLENAKAHIRKHPEQDIQTAIIEACQQLPLDKAGLVLDILLTVVTLGFYRALNHHGLFCHYTRRKATSSLTRAATEQEKQTDDEDFHPAGTFMSTLEPNG